MYTFPLQSTELCLCLFQLYTCLVCLLFFKHTVLLTHCLQIPCVPHKRVSSETRRQVMHLLPLWEAWNNRTISIKTVESMTLLSTPSQWRLYLTKKACARPDVCAKLPRTIILTNTALGQMMSFFLLWKNGSEEQSTCLCSTISLDIILILVFSDPLVSHLFSMSFQNWWQGVPLYPALVPLEALWGVSSGPADLEIFNFTKYSFSPSSSPCLPVHKITGCPSSVFSQGSVWRCEGRR